MNNLCPALHRDAITIMPALYGGMTRMPERLGNLANATKPADDLRVGFHAPFVRSQRTYVNDENVPRFRDKPDMAEPTLGEQLAALRRRSGLTMDALAEAMGYKGRSSVQRFFASHLESVSIEDALQLADAFEGKGSPPIRRVEVLTLAGADRLVEIAPNDDLPPRHIGPAIRDVPVYGTAMGTFHVEEGTPVVEQSFIDYSETIDYFARLPAYANRTGIYGIYVTGSSMEPRFDQGDPAYVDPKRPPQIGDDVVVYLVCATDGEPEPEAVLIKRLVKRSTEYIELEQYNPPARFRLETRRIKAVHRVIPRREHR